MVAVANVSRTARVVQLVDDMYQDQLSYQVPQAFLLPEEPLTVIPYCHHELRTVEVTLSKSSQISYRLSKSKGHVE